MRSAEELEKVFAETYHFEPPDCVLAFTLVWQRWLGFRRPRGLADVSRLEDTTGDFLAAAPGLVTARESVVAQCGLM